MEAESYGDAATAAFINESFVPFTVNIKEHGALFHRFDVLWTPTVLIMDPQGVERDRIEGYLPREEFRARLEMGLARAAFTAKHWEEAEKRYAQVAERYPDTPVTAEAIYWRGVSHYKGTNDHTALGEVAQQLSQKYPNSEWAKKASVWAH
ncbi:MAG TPA: tetratricopeptide repeat protein [Chthonomonadaceae bacterium]|nr:tetratricopeptide repeat protein [Chthonomonadaceae bacterium]